MSLESDFLISGNIQQSKQTAINLFHYVLYPPKTLKNADKTRNKTSCNHS